MTHELDQSLAEAKVSKMIMNPTSGTGLGYKPRTRAAVLERAKRKQSVLRSYISLEKSRKRSN